MQRRNHIIIIVILVFAAVLYLFNRSQMQRGSEVVVEVDGTVSARFPLSEDRSYTISSKEDGVNELVIASGEASVTSANCKNQVCVHSLAISKVGQSITCLPHKVHIYITGEEEAVYDAIAN